MHLILCVDLRPFDVQGLAMLLYSLGILPLTRKLKNPENGTELVSSCFWMSFYA